MPSSYQFTPYRLNTVTKSLYRNDILVPLPPKVFDVLALLVEHRGEVVSKEQFFQNVWPDSIVEESNLTQSVFVLRKTLAEGNGDHTYIETVPKRGYRFVAEVSEAQEAVPATKRRHVLWLAGGGIAAAAVAGTSFLSKSGGSGRQPVAVAVLPFENLSGDTTQEYLADGLTAGLTNELGKVSSFRVRSRNSALRHKGSRKPVGEIARDLGVTALVEGSVTRSGDRVRVNCQLVDTSEGSMLWSESYERPVKDLPSLLSEIAGNVADQVKVRVSKDEQRRLEKPGSVHADAFEAYLRGRYFLERNTPESIAKAAEQFKAALRVDSRYAAAYCGLAETQNSLGATEIGVFHPRESRAIAIGFARQALAIDPEMAEAHAALARSCLFNWEWGEAENAIRQALKLNPSCLAARNLNSTMLAGTGRFDQALQEAKLSCEYDPLSIQAKSQVIHAIKLKRQFDEALEKVSRLLDAEPDNPAVLMQAGNVNLDSGRAHQAIPLLEKSVRLSTRSYYNRAGFLARAYAAVGRNAEASAILQQLVDYKKKQYLTPCILALVNLSLKNRGEFFRWYEQSFEERSNGMFWTKVETFYDPVRNERRFQEIEKLIFERGRTTA